MDEIDALDRAWNEAYERNDRSALADILDDDFEATTADFMIVSRAQLLEPTPAALRVEFSERILRVFGATAIVRGRLRLQHKGGWIDQRFVRVYARRDGRWRAVAVQVFPVPGNER